MLVEGVGLHKNGELVVPAVVGVADHDVEEAVPVDVAHGTGRRVALAAVDVAGQGLLEEGAVAEVLVEAVGLARPEYIEVRVAVVVRVAHTHTARVLGAGVDPGGEGHIDESHLAALLELVEVEAVGRAGPVGDVDVEVAVTVEVREGHPRSAARLDRCDGDVRHCVYGKPLEGIKNDVAGRLGAPIVDPIPGGRNIFIGDAAVLTSLGRGRAQTDPRRGHSGQGSQGDEEGLVERFESACGGHDGVRVGLERRYLSMWVRSAHPKSASSVRTCSPSNPYRCHTHGCGFD